MKKLRLKATFVIFFLNLLFFFWERKANHFGLLRLIVEDFGFRWDMFLQEPFVQFPRLISHTFVHADAAHFISNFFFFLVFSISVETTIGSTYLLIIYFLSAVIAVVTQSILVPSQFYLIGASGAISGVGAAYFILFPLRSPWPDSLPRVLRWGRYIPSFLWVGFWFLSEIFQGMGQFQDPCLLSHSLSVAHWSHVAGFICGAFLMIPVIFKRKSPLNEEPNL